MAVSFSWFTNVLLKRVALINVSLPSFAVNDKPVVIRFSEAVEITELINGRCLCTCIRTLNVKAVFHPKMRILSLFTHRLCLFLPVSTESEHRGCAF